jgi:hypothetical protein
VGLGFSILVLALAVAYLRRLKLEITREGVSYRSLFRGTSSVTFEEISTIVLISPARVSLPSPETDGPSRGRKLIVTPMPQLGKPTITVPLNFLDSTAEDELVRVLEPRIWVD